MKLGHRKELTFRAFALRQRDWPDGRLTLEASAFALFTVVNLHYQLS